MPNIPHLIRDVDRHGNERLYVRVKGRPKVRIREEFGSEAFWTAYQAALGEEAPSKTPRQQKAAHGALWELVQLYRASPEFKKLGAGTRKVRAALLESICLSKTRSGRRRGDLPYALMEARHVREVRDAWADNGPEAANSRLKAMRQMFKWAVAADRMRSNPGRDVDYLDSDNPEGFHTWTIEEVEHYTKRHPIGTKAYLALAMLAFTGTRRCDAVRLGPQMEKNGKLHFTEVKGRKRIVKHRAIPILPELRQAIDASPSGHLAYLVTAFGKPFTSNGFGNWFRDRCNEAGLPQCSAHGLRKAGATIAAENGATTKQLQVIFGWESIKQAELYTRRAEHGRMIDAAMPLIVPRKGTNQ